MLLDTLKLNNIAAVNTGLNRKQNKVFNQSKVSFGQLTADTVSFSKNKADNVAFSSNSAQAEAVTLKHRFKESVKHPIYGEIQQYEVYNPANDVPETRQQVFIIENHELPQIAFGVNILTGSANEPEGKCGLAHFMEHVFFKGSMNPDGTPNLMPGEFNKKLELLGALINATPTFDNTFYYSIAPKEAYSEVVKAYADIIQHPSFPEEEINKERSVMIQELYYRVKNSIRGTAWITIMNKLFQPHPYKRSPGGLEEDLKTITRQDILDYYKNFYVPQNRQVIVYGDIKPEEALKAIESNFTELEVKSLVTPERTEPVGDVEKVTTKEMDGLEGNAYTVVGFRGPESSNLKDVAALRLLNVILGTGDSARLNRELLEKQHKVIGINSSYDEFKEASAFTIETREKAEDLNDVLLLINKELETIIKNGVSEEELNKAKNIVLQTLVNNTEQFNDFVNDLGLYFAKGSIKEDVKLLDIINNLTAKDLQEVAAKYLNPEKAQIFNAVPSSEIENSKKPNSVSFSGRLSASDKSVRLNNGSELIVRKRPGNLGTTVAFHLKGGKSLDTQAGQTDLLSTMLMRGTANKTVEELQKELGNNAIEIEVKYGDYPINLTPDGILVRGSSLNKERDKLFELISEIITTPRFLTGKRDVIEDFEDQKELFSTRLKNPEASEKAFDALITTIYPETHPYWGLSMSTVAENISKLTIDDIKKVYKQTFTPSNMAITVVGDVEIDEVKDTFNKLLSPLKPGQAITAKIDPIEIKETIIKGVPEDAEARANQVKIFKAWKAPNSQNSDYIAMKLLHYILSLGMSSRLFKEFREKREGLTYDASSINRAYKDDGLSYLTLETTPKNLQTCLDLFDQEIKKLLTENVSKEELKKVKNLFKNLVLLDARSSKNLSEGISFHRIYDTDSLEEKIEKMDKVTVEDIRRVAEKYLSKPSVTTVQASSKVLTENGLLD